MGVFPGQLSVEKNLVGFIESVSGILIVSAVTLKWESN